MAIILQVVNRSGQVLHTARYSKTRIKIGRGFDNDLILSDPYVDPQHIALELDPVTQEINCVDCGSENGVWINRPKRHKVAGVEKVLSGQAINIGKTTIRVFTTNHIVVPAALLSAWEMFYSQVSRPAVTFLLVFLLFTLIFVNGYLDNPAMSQLHKLVPEILFLYLAAICYGGVWALIGRTFKHDGRFAVHFAVALIAIIALQSYRIASPIIAFNLGLVSGIPWLETAVYGGLVFAVVYFSSTLATYMRRAVKISFCMALPAVFVILRFIASIDSNEFQRQPPYEKILVSPAWNFRSGIESDEFLDQARLIYQNDEVEQDE